jgi:catechol 2,3-dioxygenase-like lactoylglutathione lyase family enzyme
MTPPKISSISPSFIVRNVTTAISFYRDMLGFVVEHQQPEREPFFAIVQRDSAMIFMKSVGAEPMPNRKRSAPEVAMRWDAYVSVPDPDALAAEFISRSVKFFRPLADTSEGLRGFEIEDADGYLLFFGRPRENSK